MTSGHVFDKYYTEIVNYNTGIVLVDNTVNYTVTPINYDTVKINGLNFKLLCGVYINKNSSLCHLCPGIETESNEEIFIENCKTIFQIYYFIVKFKLNNRGVVYASIYSLKQIIYNILNTTKHLNNKVENIFCTIIENAYRIKIQNTIQSFYVKLAQGIEKNNISEWMKSIEDNVDTNTNTCTIVLKKNFITVDDKKLYFENSTLIDSSFTETITYKRIVYNGGCIINNHKRMKDIFSHVTNYNTLVLNKIKLVNSTKYFHSKATLFVGTSSTIITWFLEYMSFFSNASKKILKITTNQEFKKTSFHDLLTADIIFITFNLLDKTNTYTYKYASIIEYSSNCHYLNNIYFHSIYVESNNDTSNLFNKSFINNIPSLYRWLIVSDRNPLLYDNITNHNPFLFFTNIRSDFMEYSLIESLQFLYKKFISKSVSLITSEQNIRINMTDYEENLLHINRVSKKCINILQLPYHNLSNDKEVKICLTNTFQLDSLKSQSTSILECCICYSNINIEDSRIFFTCGHYTCSICHAQRVYSNGQLAKNKCVLCNKDFKLFMLYTQTKNYITKYNCSKISQLLLTIPLFNTKNIIYVNNTSDLRNITSVFTVEKIPFLLAKDVVKFSKSTKHNFLILNETSSKKFACNININALIMLSPNPSTEKTILSRLYFQTDTLNIFRYMFKNTFEDNIYVHI